MRQTRATTTRRYAFTAGIVLSCSLLVVVGFGAREAHAQWVQEFDGVWYQNTGGPFNEWTALDAKYDADDMAQLGPILRRIRDETKTETVYHVISHNASCGRSATRVIETVKDDLLPQGWDLDQMNSVDPFNLVVDNGTAHTVSMFTSPKGNSYIIDRYSGKIEIIAVDHLQGNDRVRAKFGERSVLDRYYRVMVNPLKVFAKDNTSLHFKGEEVCPRPDDREPQVTRVVTATDPNDKLGLGGAGASRYLADVIPMQYRIRFENVDTASAPAQEVVIVDDIDLDVFDPSTFLLGAVGFGDRVVDVPDGRTTHTTTIDLRPEIDILLRIVAGIEPTSGRAVWRFSSIDPDTGELPADPFEGFLPPNQASPEGEGFVSFMIRPRQDLASGTVISNQARIYFDLNEPIDTPPWVNVIDRTAPQSSIASISKVRADTTATVSWSGSDDASGVETYSIFVSLNGGEFLPWIMNTTATSAVFSATPDGSSTYAFYSIARDAAGNVEAAKTVGEATTTMVVGVEEIFGADVPAVFALRQNYPNPAAGETTIEFDLPEASSVQLVVFDVAGRQVLRLLDDDKSAGRYRVTWDVGGLASGTYFYRIVAGGFAATRQVVVVR